MLEIQGIKTIYGYNTDIGYISNTLAKILDPYEHFQKALRSFL